MEHLKMHSVNKVAENIDKIAALFPNCVTETTDENGKVKRALDFDMLKQELSEYVVEGLEERYQFTWPDKKKAMLAANAPINKTLRPCREESVDFDTTENLYIEGDNLEVLKLLQETYLGKVKMIYIDPPYNTGNDFVYNDDFAQSAEDYMANSGQYDEEGMRMVQNTESNGRFHTDWLNMMYPRLKLARDFLTDDGVIFISIDDNEVENLKKCCHELFGENNFIAQIVWERAYSPINLMKHFSPAHDYILCYAKNVVNAKCNGIPRSEDANDRYSNPDNDPRGPWKSSDLSVGPAVQDNIYEIVTPSGRGVMPPPGRSWRVSKKAFSERLADNRIWFGTNGDSVPSIKRFLAELKKSGITPMTYWRYDEVGHSQEATQFLSSIFDGKKYFEYPKPIKLIERCIQLYSSSDSIILDFFSGSATTAHAVLNQNNLDSGNRRFILVQLPEPTNVKSEAFKAGYKNICEIGKERIRRAGQKIKDENPLTTQDLDIGFRVLKLDTSNMEDVYYTPGELVNGQIDLFQDNVKADRTPEDLLFQVMLDLGAPLSSKIELTEIAGKKVYKVAEGHLMACFDNDVTDEVITAIAKQQPSYFVMRDSSMADDSVAINFEQIFATYSKDTNRKVI